MGLKEVLSKMKIVEIEEPPASEAPPSFTGRSSSAAVPGPPTDIRELLGTVPDVPPIDEKKLEAEIGGESAGDDAEIPDFPAIYKAAGIANPAHGYTAYKVLEIFASPGFVQLDMRAKAAALTGFLNMNPAGPVPITDVVRDAVQRDQALDRFEDFLRTKLTTRAEQVDKENAALQAEVDELTRRNRDRMEANRLALETDQARFARWQVIKKTEERKLFDAVNPFVEANPISTGDAPPPAEAPPANPEGGNP